MTVIVVAYDISRSDRRDRVAKLLFTMGLSRVERSLYVGRGGVAKARDIARAVERLIDPETDVVDILVVPDVYWRSRITVGGGRKRVPGLAPSPYLHFA